MGAAKRRIYLWRRLLPSFVGPDPEQKKFGFGPYYDAVIDILVEFSWRTDIDPCAARSQWQVSK